MLGRGGIIHGRNAHTLDFVLICLLLVIGSNHCTFYVHSFSLNGNDSITTSSPPSSSYDTSRRNLLQNSFRFVGTCGVALGTSSILIDGATPISRSSFAAHAAETATLGEQQQVSKDDNDLIDVYFGCGCFWHVQHEFVEAERRILNRNDLELTSRAGYAGGKGEATNKNDLVCYHNAQQVGDYGKLGHAEVVKLTIPKWSFGEFAKEYYNLFNKDGYRPDQWGDVGSEYRNLIGIPGGIASKELVKSLIDTSQANGDKLDFAKGKGNDPDARALAFIMDSNEYPFYVAEQYHQFHDGFNFGENYPNSYNGLASKLAKENVLGKNNCPNGLLGIGALGL